MLKLALMFLFFAVASGAFGYANSESAMATLAQMLFGIFVVLFFGALAAGVATSGHRRIGV
ncbi:MAG: DUF1328 domain-containing protein [Xanthobacteraceae bacterium]